MAGGMVLPAFFMEATMDVIFYVGGGFVAGWLWGGLIVGWIKGLFASE